MAKTKTIIIFIIAFFGVLVFTKSSLAATYYVDNSCANNGNGLSQTCASSPGEDGPFNSLANAQSGLTGDQSDNSLLFKKGQTFSGQFTVGAYGSAGHPFTISSYGNGGAPIINGGNSNIYISCANCQYIVIDGIDCNDANGGWGAGIYISGPAGNVTVQNSTIRNAGTAANCHPGGNNCTHGIHILNSSNNTINGNAIYDGDYNGIQLYRQPGQTAQNNIISNNTIYRNQVTGIAIFGGATSRLSDSNTEVYGNESYNNSAGIYLVNADYIKIYENTFHDNGHYCGGNCQGETYGFAIQSGSYNDIHDNIIYNSYNTGIGIYGDDMVLCGAPGGSCSGFASYNKLYRNVVYGTIFGVWSRDINWQCYANQSVGSGNEIYYNIFMTSGAQYNFIIGDTHATARTGNVAYNNVFYGAAQGVNFENAQNEDVGWTFKNNIFAGNSTYNFDANKTPSGITLSNNIYYKSAGGTLARYNGTSYTSANISTLDGNAETSDPKFVGTSSWGDFRLQSDSPAINAGVNLGDAYDDGLDPNDINWPPSTLDQDNYGSWEMGAFVYGGAVSDTTPPTSPTGVTII